MSGEPGPDLDERRVDAAAQELLHAAGRPEVFILELVPYERESWRVAARRAIRAYQESA